MIDFDKIPLPDSVLYAQLSEEANELAQAALKMFRILDGRNPTPVTKDQAIANIKEEIGDVILCLWELGFATDPAKYQEAMAAKAQRWATRLAEVPKPAPLTLEELRQMDGEPVWIDNRFLGQYWGVVRIDGARSASIVGVEYNIRLDDECGKTWNAYRHKPEEV